VNLTERKLLLNLNNLRTKVRKRYLHKETTLFHIVPRDVTAGKQVPCLIAGRNIRSELSKLSRFRYKHLSSLP